MKELCYGDLIEERYRVKYLLGEGGMNRVYLVEEVSTSRQWAMKVTRPPEELGSTTQEAYNKFLKEISILTTIKHPNLPALVDYFSFDRDYFIIEEYIEGESLEEFIKKNLPREIDVVRWAITICSILDLLHRNGIIFRDLKPANLMLKLDGDVKLIDFDIARRYKEGKLQDTALLGTPGYAAPETYGKAQSDARSDIYSLGATIHHLVTGIDPQDTPFQFQPLGQLRAGVSQELQAIVEKCLKMKPLERYHQIQDVAQDLERLRDRIAAAKPGSLLTQTGIPGMPSLDFLPSHWVESISDAATFIDDTIARFTGKPPVHPPLLKGVVTGPPCSYFRPVTNWSPYAGDSFDIYQDTYLYHPGRVTGVSPGISCLQVQPGHILVVNFSFAVPYPGYGNYAPRPLALKLQFLMPLDENYTQGCGTFAAIPGSVIEYNVSTPNCWSGDSSGTVIDVVHNHSYVRVLLKWQPDKALTSLSYDTGKPWQGPRVMVHAECGEYGWQYTKGFIIR